MEHLSLMKYDHAIRLRVRGEGRENRGVHFTLMLDVSGSMGTSVKNAQGDDNGLSRLDLVKHAVKTVVHSMRPTDRISVITFNNNLKSLCDHVNKDDFPLDRLNAVQPEGGTDLYKALLTCMTSRQMLGGLINVVYILTDGEPSFEPMPNIVTAFVKAVRADCPVIHPMVFTSAGHFDLMTRVSKETGGVLRYINDATMVGTSFCHAVATAQTLWATSITVNDERVGELGWGVDRLIYTSNPNAMFDIQLLHVDKAAWDCMKNPHWERGDNSVNRAAQMLHDISLNLLSGGKLVASDYSDNPYYPEFSPLLEGKDPEVTMARHQCMNTWGRWYLAALSDQIRFQVPVNFKDPSSHVFSQDVVFQQVLDRVVKVFNELPPPVPSYFTQTPVASMATYNDSHGGCVAAETIVTVYDTNGQPVKKRIADVKPGDLLAGGWTVRFLVQNHGYKGPLVRDHRSGLIITPWHPVAQTDETGRFGPFYFPAESIQFSPYPNPHGMDVYTVVMNHDVGDEDVPHNVLTEDGSLCWIALGHGLTSKEVNHVVGHPLYGAKFRDAAHVLANVMGPHDTADDWTIHS